VYFINIDSFIDEAAFVHLRRLRLRTLCSLSAYFPVLSLFFLLGAHATGRLVGSEILAVVLLNLWHLRLLDCPQCGQPFYSQSKWTGTNLTFPFSRECMHCTFSIVKGPTLLLPF
jgi:hypothetical protein